MKKMMTIAVTMMLAVTILTGCSEKKGVIVGISQFAEHGSLDNCREGFLAGLKEAGFTEGENLKVNLQNAQSDGGTANQIAQQFAGDRVDLICAIATPSAQSAYNAAMASDIPVVYTAITDPVLAQLASADGTPVGEVTGTSDMLPVEEQLQMIRKFLPDAKTLGILYTTSEVNSESTIAVYEQLAGLYGFELKTVGVNTTADIPLAADSILESVDCLTNLTDNTVVSSLPLILDKANDKKIPVFGSEIEQVKMGCLAAQGLDYFKLGKQTGEMAAKVLKGEAKASEMNYLIIKESDLYINAKTAENLGICIPEEMLGTALEIFAEITE